MSKQTGTATEEIYDPAAPTIEAIAQQVDRLRAVDRPRYRRLWAYCRNPMRTVASVDGQRPYRQAQEWGLPQRITGARACGSDVFACEIVDGAARKEVVIENDIGWRVETMVDYLFGKPLVIESAAPDPMRRAIISELLRQILSQNGGILLFQQLALLGATYGFVDVLVKLEQSAADRLGDESTPNNTPACGTRDLGEPPAGCRTLPDGAGPSDGRVVDADSVDGDASPLAGPAPRTEPDGSGSLGGTAHPDASEITSRAAQLARLARMVRLEVVEPARALPFLSAINYRDVVAYGQTYEMARASGVVGAAASGVTRRASWIDRLRRLASRDPLALRSGDEELVTIVELITPTRWTRYEDGKVVAAGENSLGRIPLVHVQNTAVPFEYAGASDVEPLIPLQDELNTRLSDRANRIALQSFKMYLGKGIENFTSMPVSPGRMWMSDNERADVIEFGGDSSCPSEEAHVSDVREALDKTSGVTPIAAGAIKGRIGRLTSAAALRVTLQALLAKTEKKRTTYGAAIGQICEASLAWLNRAGLFATTPDERRIEINWPSPLPQNQLEKLTEAEVKSRLGVPKDLILRELGY